MRTRLLLGLALWAGTWILGAYKILEWARWPMLVVCVLIAVIGWTRYRRVLWWALYATAIATLVIAFTPITRALVAPLVRRDPLSPHVNAVVVLHSGSTDDGLLNPTSLDRLLSGMRLLKRGTANTIIITEPHGIRSSENDQRATIALASPPPVTVFIARDVRTTRDEALKSAAIAKEHGIHTIALVTSPMHSRRACATFEHAGFAVSCIPSADRQVAIGVLHDPIDRISAWQEWLYETLGTIKYRAAGWI